MSDFSESNSIEFPDDAEIRDMDHESDIEAELDLPPPDAQRNLGRIAVSEQVMKRKTPSTRGKVNFEITTPSRKAAYEANMLQKARRLESIRNNRSVVKALDESRKREGPTV